MVDESAQTIAAYTYDPFGTVTSGAPEFDSFYGYNGEETNPVIGKQYLRARYYDTDNGRFDVADNYLGDCLLYTSVGWYPEYESKGEFVVQIIGKQNWQRRKLGILRELVRL